MFEIFSKIQKHKDKFWRRNTIFCFTFSQFRQKPHSKAHWGGGFFCFSKTKKHCFPSHLATKSIKIFRLRRACFFSKKNKKKRFFRIIKNIILILESGIFPQIRGWISCRTRKFITPPLFMVIDIL